MKEEIVNKLWCDLSTDVQRIKFLRSGRAVEAGLIDSTLVEDVARAFESRDKMRTIVALRGIHENY